MHKTNKVFHVEDVFKYRELKKPFCRSLRETFEFCYGKFFCKCTNLDCANCQFNFWNWPSKNQLWHLLHSLIWSDLVKWVWHLHKLNVGPDATVCSTLYGSQSADRHLASLSSCVGNPSSSNSKVFMCPCLSTWQRVILSHNHSSLLIFLFFVNLRYCSQLDTMYHCDQASVFPTGSR